MQTYQTSSGKGRQTRITRLHVLNIKYVCRVISENTLRSWRFCRRAMPYSLAANTRAGVYCARCRISAPFVSVSFSRKSCWRIRNRVLTKLPTTEAKPHLNFLRLFSAKIFNCFVACVREATRTIFNALATLYWNVPKIASPVQAKHMSVA